MWSYTRPHFDASYEIGIPSTSVGPALCPHLHDAVQVLILSAGDRRMRVVREEIALQAGDMLILPSRVVHGPVQGKVATWRGLNLYLDPEAPLGTTVRVIALDRVPRWVDRPIAVPGEPIAVLLQLIGAGEVRWTGTMGATRGAEVDAGLIARETRIRRFVRATGMPPAAHDRMLRLDRARRLLADGLAPAEAAAATGFADQSHLGRLFRAVYGTSPARYAAGR